MPLYTYRCRECETYFEVKQSFSDDPVSDCPNCDAEGSVYRVVQPAGVVFKGSGWYVTDSKSDRTNLTSPTSNGEASTDSNGNGSTESKPETKAEPKADSKMSESKSTTSSSKSSDS